MKIIQATKENLAKITSNYNTYVHLESQPYGQPQDQVHNIAVPDYAAEEIVVSGLGRLIEDTGRTAGFWQILAGRGVFSARTAFGVSDRIKKIVQNSKGARIFIKAGTWKEIIERSELRQELKDVLFGEENKEIDDIEFLPSADFQKTLDSEES